MNRLFQKQSLKSCRGFTLIEVLVVVLIIGLFTVASGGFFVKTYKAVLFKNNVKDIVNAVGFARLWAVENQRECVFCYDSVNQKMMIALDDAEGGKQTLKNQYVKEIELGVDCEVVSFEVDAVESEGFDDFAGAGLSFYPDGSCDRGLIELTNGRENFTLVITAATGNVEVYQCRFEELEITAKSVDLDLQSDEDGSFGY